MKKFEVSLTNEELNILYFSLLTFRSTEWFKNQQHETQDSIKAITQKIYEAS